MKKLALLFLISALFFAANSSGGERISATPADRLLGHWSNDLEEHYYYGKPADGFGSFIIVPPDGESVFHNYKIISQSPEGEEIVVQLLLSNGDTREETYAIPKDGKELKKTTLFRGVEVISVRHYVDDKEKP